MKKSKILALALAVVMIFSALSVSAFAAFDAPECTDYETKFATAIAASKLTVNSKVSSTGSAWDQVVKANTAQEKTTYPNMFFWEDEGEGVILLNKYPGVNNWSGLNKDGVRGDYKFVDGTYENYRYTVTTNGVTEEKVIAYANEGNNVVRLDPANGMNNGYVISSQVFVFSTNIKFLEFDAGFRIFYAGLKPNSNNATGRDFYDALNIDQNGELFWKKAATGVKLTTDVYYNISMVLYPTSTTVLADIYVDGVKVAGGLEFVGSTHYNYYFSYMMVNKMNGACSGEACDCEASEKTQITNAPLSYYTNDIKGNKFYMCEHDKQIAYMKDATFYYVDPAYYAANDCLVTYNNGNTVNGYDLTINNGVLGLNYYLNLTGDVLADANAKVVFTTARGEVQETFVKDVTAETNGSYKFTAKVSSVEMASAIKMEIVVSGEKYNIYKNGTATKAYEYSVKEYAEQLLDDATYGDIVKAMLNYGAAAQVYFDYNTEKLASENYTEALAQVTGTDISAVAITGTAPAGTKAALILDSNTSIVIYNAQGEKIGEKTGINSKNLDAEYTIECEGGVNVKVSVLAVGEKVLESTASAEYKNLIKALKLFSDASIALQ